MKYAILLLFATSSAAALQTYTFRYRTADELRITVEAATIEAGYAKAAKLCFKILTKDKYPGDEEGLRIIDVCANPIGY